MGQGGTRRDKVGQGETRRDTERQVSRQVRGNDDEAHPPPKQATRPVGQCKTGRRRRMPKKKNTVADAFVYSEVGRTSG